MSNQDQILPIGAETKMRPMKHLNDNIHQYNTDETSQFDRAIIKRSDNDDRVFSYRKSDGNLMSESVLNIDFLAEGERMVSELCNSFEIESKPTQQGGMQKKYNYHTSDENKNKSVEPSEALLASVEKAHERIPNQIVQLAVEACTDAENIAIAHHNRPCFKNIHSICAKTRSNVKKPDSAVANLHSQGVPWVIKNFIFSFVRILDGWKGIKELLNEKHDSFSRIENQYYSPNIRECFFEWQAVTKDMLTHIYKTYKCLDQGFTMEQKSFTRNYYATNPTAPRHQNQNKFQQTKSTPNSSRVNTPIQPSSSNGSWMQSNLYMDQNWPSKSTGSTGRNNVPITPTGTQNLYQVGEKIECEHDHNKTCFKPEPGYQLREAKSRQTWTITNTLDCQPMESFPHFEQREFYSHMRQNIEACFNKNTVAHPFQANVNDEMMHRKNLELKTKMIPLSQVERHMLPNMCSSSEMRSYTQKNNCCGDTKEEIEFVSNWGQVIQKDPAEYFSPSHGSQISNVMSFSSNVVAPVQFMEKEGEDFYELSTVYMKPGSYKVPIKSLDPLCKYPSTSSDTCDKFEDIPKCKGPFVTNQAATNTYNLDTPWSFAIKRPVDFFLRNDKGLGFNKSAPEMSSSGSAFADLMPPMAYDKAWEAAKQSAPKLVDCMHDGSKSDVARLYDALGLTHKNEEFDGKIQKKQDDTFTINECLYKTNPSDDNTSNNEGINENNFTHDNISKLDNNNKDIRCNNQDDCKRSCTKNSTQIKHFTSWYQPNKKKPISINLVKKFEKILTHLMKMNESNFIYGDMDLRSAPRFYEVVKHPMCLSDISTKLNNSSYTESEQVVNDFRRIFNNVRIYVKSYPDAVMKKKINKISTEFDKVLHEEFPETDNKSNNNNKRGSDNSQQKSRINNNEDSSNIKDVSDKLQRTGKHTQT